MLTLLMTAQYVIFLGKKANSSLVLMFALDLCQTSGLVLLYLAELYLEDLFSRDLSLSVDECSMKLF